MARELRHALRAALGRRCPENEIYLLQNFADVEVLARWGEEPLRATCLRGSRNERGGPAPYYALVEIGNGPRDPYRWGVIDREGVAIQAAAGERWLNLAGPLAPTESYEPIVEAFLQVAEEIAPPTAKPTVDHLWPFGEVRRDGPSEKETIKGTEAESGALRLVTDALESAGVFGNISSSRAGASDLSHLVVLTGRPPPRLLEARHATTTLKAEARSKGVEVRLAVHDVGWPKGTRKDVRVLPGSWVTAWIGRSAEVVERIPVGPREHRLADEVMWLMTGDEVLGGELTAFIGDVGRALEDAARGPYR